MGVAIENLGGGREDQIGILCSSSFRVCARTKKSGLGLKEQMESKGVKVLKLTELKNVYEQFQ